MRKIAIAVTLFVMAGAVPCAQAVSPLYYPTMPQMPKTSAPSSQKPYSASVQTSQVPMPSQAPAEKPQMASPTSSGKPFIGSIQLNGLPDDIAKQLGVDYNFLCGITGDGASGLHREIFGDVSGKSYRAYLESHIRTVSFGGPYLWMKDMFPDNKKKDAKKDGTVAYVENMVDPSTIWLLKPYAEPDSPMMFRLGVMIHEARHSEGGGWPHVNCPIGSKPSTLVGKPACDTTPQGAYGVGGIFLKNVALHCTNCTDKVRQDAALYGNKQLGRIISLKGKQQLREDFGE